MSDLTFDYEFLFTNSFDQIIYDQCSISDPSGDRQPIIEGIVTQILQIFNNLNNNINQMSTFCDYNDSRYKITVHNSEF